MFNFFNKKKDVDTSVPEDHNKESVIVSKEQLKIKALKELKLEDLRLEELRLIAKDRGLVSYNHLKKDALMKRLSNGS